jgi:hypothetical protein
MFGSQNALLSSSSLDFSHFSVPTLRLLALSALDFKHSNPRTLHLIDWSFRTSSHQYHSMVLTLPLFSYSYALFCSGENAMSIFFSIFRTLWQKHPGWGYAILNFSVAQTSNLAVHLKLFRINTYEKTGGGHILQAKVFSFFSIPAGPEHRRSERASGARDLLFRFGAHGPRVTDHGPRLLRELPLTAPAPIGLGASTFCFPNLPPPPPSTFNCRPPHSLAGAQPPQPIGGRPWRTHPLRKGSLRSDVLSSDCKRNSQFRHPFISRHSERSEESLFAGCRKDRPGTHRNKEQRNNGRAPRTRWTNSPGGRARPRRPDLLDLRCRQSSRRVRRQPLPLFVQYFSSPGRHAPSERPAPRRPQGRHL